MHWFGRIFKTATVRWRYLLAVSSVIIISVILARILESVSAPIPYVTFFPAVIVAALYGGILTGLIVSLVSVLSLIFIWHAPFQMQGLNLQMQIIPLVLFVLSSAMIAYVCQLLRHAYRRAEHAEMRAAAQESQLRYQHIIEICEEGVWIVDRNWKTTFVNDRMAQILGYLPEEMLGRHICEFMDDEGRAAAQEKMANREQGKREVHDFRFVRRDGACIWLLISTSPMIDEDGSFIGALAMLTDITDRRSAQDALIASEEKHRMLFEIMRQGAFYQNSDGSLSDVNSAALKMFGLTRQEFLSRNVNSQEWNLIREDGSVLKNEEIPSSVVFETGVPAHDIVVGIFNRQRNDYVWVISNSIPQFRPGDEKPYRVFVTLHDITESKRIEAQLKENDMILHRLVDSNIIGIIKADSEHILDANDLFLSMIGHTREDLVFGRISWQTITPAELLPRDHRAMQRLRESGVCAPYEKEYYRKDGSRVPVLIGAAAISFVPMRYICFVMDLTERQQAEAKLKEAHRRKDDFLAILSHELRNPLAAISMAMEVWRRDDSPEMLAEIKDTFARQVRQLSRLVDDLLELSRITQRKIELRWGDVLLSEVVERAVASVHELMEMHQHQFSLKMPDYPVYAWADATRLEQILVNLLTNAAKYTDDGGKISLALEEKDGALLLGVEDNGIGIPLESQGQIFELFGQVESSRHRAKGGLGIGLNLVQQLVQMHGGTISVHSNGLGMGSKFTVMLPVAKKMIGIKALKEKSSSVIEPLTVLLVEDNMDTAKMLSALLRLDGHRVEVAYDGISAVDKARAQLPQVILCDLGLPGQDGFHVASSLRSDARLDGSLILALSGYGQKKDIARSIDAGFDGHLLKPLDLDKLHEYINKWMKSVVASTSVQGNLSLVQ